MADMNETLWIDTNVEVVESSLKKEFENFTIRHRTDNSQTHAFIVNDGKKRFTLLIGAPSLADRSFTPARIDHLLKKNVAGEMRLLGKAGFAQVRDTTISYPADDLPSAQTKSERKHFGSQLLKKT